MGSPAAPADASAAHVDAASSRVGSGWKPLLHVLLTALLTLGAGCAKPKSDPLAEAQLFFDRVRHGDLKAAFESSSFAFQNEQTQRFFTERAMEYGLHEAAVALLPLSDDGKLARIDVAVTKKSGLQYKLVLTLENDHDHWRVYSLRSPRDPKSGISENRFSILGHPAAINTAAAMEVPDQAALRKLVKDSMLLFSDAIKTKSFTAFYEQTSVEWQKELTEQKLKNAFKAFLDKDVDMSSLRKEEAIFDPDLPPRIGTDGLLGVTGYFPTKPYEVHFTLRYIYELPEWKLLGLNSYLKDLNEPATPAPKATPAP